MLQQNSKRLVYYIRIEKFCFNIEINMYWFPMKY